MRLNLLHKEQGAHEDSVWCLSWGKDSSTLATGAAPERPPDPPRTPRPISLGCEISWRDLGVKADQLAVMPP